MNSVAKLDQTPQEWILGGFVDLHMHGGGGYDVTKGDREAVRGALEFHSAHGTRYALASLVSAPLDELEATCERLADLAEAGEIAGIHLEGPFLAINRCGAHNPAHLTTPSAAAVDRLLRAGRGSIRQVTIAPELPGALNAIRRIVDAGAVAAIGHTDATYDETVAGIEAGARLATHIFNAMRPILHRNPGPVPALLEHPDVVVEVIADGVHLHDSILRFLFEHLGPHRIALITDAIPAAGLPDGIYSLGDQDISIVEGVVRLTGDVTAPNALAGSTLTLDRAVRNVVAAGVDVEDAISAASSTPARVIGVDASLSAGGPRLVLEQDFSVRWV